MKTMLKICCAVAVFSTMASSSSADPRVIHMVSRTAAAFGVPPKLAVNVAQVETGNSCGVIGSSGERGPLQIKPASAAGLGYKNIRHASCQRQLDAGMAHLAMCYKMAHGNWNRAAACHNGGPGILKSRRVKNSVRQYVRMVMR